MEFTTTLRPDEQTTSLDRFASVWAEPAAERQAPRVLGIIPLPGFLQRLTERCIEAMF